MSVARQLDDDSEKHLCEGAAESQLTQSDASGRPCELLCVKNTADFAALRMEWDHLHGQCENASVFMTWAWHHTWWSVFGDNNELSLLCVRDNGKLVAMMPLYIRQFQWPRAQRVMFIGTGEGETDEVATEYLDALVTPEYAPTAISLMLNWLDEHCGDMYFEFQQVLEDSYLYQALQQKNNDWILAEKITGFRYRLDLHKETDAIPMAQSRLKRVKRSLRAVERDGGIEQISVFDIPHMNDVLEKVSELSDQRQQHAGRVKSAFSSARFNQFHHRVLPLLYQLDGADVHHFYLNEELCAALYCFYDDTTCHYYQSGFEQSMANRYMPLTVAHLMEIQRNREAGRQYYDFMRGDAGSYKNEFNCETTPMVNIVRFPSQAYRRIHETFTIGRQRVVKELRRLGVARHR